MTLDIQLKNISLRFGKFDALKDISLTMEGGKIHGLIGRNGAGKTSLLSLIAAFREASEGQVEIGGDPVFENPERMQQVAFVYEKNYTDEYDPFSSLIEFAARYRPNFDEKYAEHLSKRFNLPIDKPVYKFSKGMQSAASVILGLASRAPITIFDEAYIGMDAPNRQVFYEELLSDQAEHPRTIILSTHLVSEMDYLFDRVAIIDKGRLLLHEDADVLTARGASITGTAEAVEQFTAGMNILNEQKLGGVKSVMVYGELDEQQLLTAHKQGLEIGPVPLQDLFIHLTGEAV
ncbi:ATP-binding cassette domain-containing protein [Planococcus sp. YIM B11945]|uniref:ATP-binding cassette domain-containing protein n=1 Tax=Planococcus sp. YIM B11945 TaxID=3435410 RepID=UPI003D7DC264